MSMERIHMKIDVITNDFMDEGLNIMEGRLSGS